MAEFRVLVVEDEWLVAEEHRYVLEEAGFGIVGPVPSVKLAIKLIETEAISAAVLDIGLNGETSAPLVPHLQHRKIPFVFVSGYTPSDVPEMLRAYPFLAKPVVATALVSALNKMLGQDEQEFG
ncbi:response regulator [Mesorhizobium argentiipisi]|uniref:Response regulator n=1 Tax=Mesorhizobium argentiipisi TaxID=3015175 RepID=A0ABU8KKD5_9HYPH